MKANSKRGTFDSLEMFDRRFNMNGCVNTQDLTCTIKSLFSEYELRKNGNDDIDPAA